MTSPLNLQPFPFPDDLESDLIQFYRDQPSFSLDELGQHAGELSRYVGVYFLYYTGNAELYKALAAANTKSLVKPIYVGKAVAVGARSGNLEQATQGLFHRLNIHKNSITEAEGLDVADFQVKVIAMEGAAAVQWAEQTFIRRLQPAWNVAISGFGIKVPGAGRNEQKVSVWDTLHPGRTLAKDLTNQRDLVQERMKAITKMASTIDIDLEYSPTDVPAAAETPEVTPAPATIPEDTEI
jgi:hypothetical protein